MGEEEKKMVEKRVESLGWLTESTIMPKKHKAIAGVGASSILELKAHLYKSQQDSKKEKELFGSADIQFQRAKKKISPHDSFSVKNAGVEARAHKDKLELKAVTDGSASYAALERKAELYDKLVRGELSDGEDEEKYCVDFSSKNPMYDEQQQSQPPETSGSQHPENAADQSGDSLPLNTKFVGPGRTMFGRFDNDEHKRFVR